MSARDSESGSSTYKGGSGRAGGLGNGGLGGGMGGGGNYGGGMGGGAGRMGGIGSRTGLQTGNTMFGGMAFGRPGSAAMNSSAWGIRPQAAIAQGPLSGARPRPASIPGVNPVPQNVPAIEDVPMPTFEDPMAMYTTLKPPKTPSVQGWLPGWPGTGQWWGNQAPYQNNSSLNPRQAPNPLANDATSFIKRDGAPLRIGGMQGGMGMPGYSNPGVPGFGGRR